METRENAFLRNSRTRGKEGRPLASANGKAKKRGKNGKPAGTANYRNGCGYAPHKGKQAAKGTHRLLYPSQRAEPSIS